MDCTQRIVEEVGSSRKKVATLYILGTNYSIFSGINNIGRDPDKSDIFIDNPTISKNHAVIRNFDDQHIILDLGSTNKTIIDAKAPLIPYDQYHLRHDCPVQFGEVLGTYYYEQDDSDSRSGGGSPEHVRPTNPIEKILDRNVDDVCNSSNGDVELMDYLICPSSPIINSSCSKRWEKSKSTKRSEDSESIHSAETQISVEEREFLKNSKPKLCDGLMTIHEADTQIPNNQRNEVGNNETKSPSPNSFSDRLLLSESFNEDNAEEMQHFKRFSSSFCIPETQDVRNSLLKSNISNNISIAESQSDSIMGEIPYVDHSDSNDIINYKEDTNSSDCNYENVSSQCLLRSYTALPKLTFEDSLQENKSRNTTKSIPETEDIIDTAVLISKNNIQEDEELTDCEDVELNDQKENSHDIKSVQRQKAENTAKYGTLNDKETQIISDIDLVNIQMSSVAGPSTHVSDIEDANSIFDQPTQSVPNSKQQSPVAGTSTNISDNEDTNNIFDQPTQAVPNYKGQSPISVTNINISDVDDLNSIYDQPTQAVPNPEHRINTNVSNIDDTNNIFDQTTQIAPNIKVEITSPTSITSINISDVDDPNNIFDQPTQAAPNIKVEKSITGTNVSNTEDINNIYDQSTQPVPISKNQSPVAGTSTNVSDNEDTNSIYDQPTQVVPNYRQDPVVGISSNVSDIEDTNNFFDQPIQPVPISKNHSPVAGTSTNISDNEDTNSIYDQPTQAAPKSTGGKGKFDEEEYFNMPTQVLTRDNVLTSNTSTQKISAVVDLCENANNDFNETTNVESSKKSNLPKIGSSGNGTINKPFNIDDFYNETTQIYPGLENTINQETEELKQQSTEKSLIEIETQLNAEKENIFGEEDSSTDSEMDNETKNQLSIKENVTMILKNVKKLTCSTPMTTAKEKNRNSKKNKSTNKENVFDEEKTRKSEAMSIQLSPINDDYNNYEEVLYEDTDAIITAENSMKTFASKLSDKPRPTPKELFGDSSESEVEKLAVLIPTKRYRKGPLKAKKESEKVLSPATRKSSRPRKKVKYFDEIFDEPGPSVEDSEETIEHKNETSKTLDSVMPKIPDVKHNIMIRSEQDKHSMSFSSLLIEPNKVPAKPNKLIPKNRVQSQELVLKSKSDDYNTSDSSLLLDKIPTRPTRSLRKKQISSDSPEKGIITQNKKDLRQKTKATIKEKKMVSPLADKISVAEDKTRVAIVCLNQYKKEYKKSTRTSKITETQSQGEDKIKVNTEEKNMVKISIGEDSFSQDKTRTAVVRLSEFKKPTRYSKTAGIQNLGESQTYKIKTDEENIASSHVDKNSITEDRIPHDKIRAAPANEYKKEYKKSTRHSKTTEIQTLGDDQTYNINTRPSRLQNDTDDTKVGKIVEENETNVKEINTTTKRRASKRTHTEIDKNENADTKADLLVTKSKKKNMEGDRDVSQKLISPSRVSIRNEMKNKFRILFTSVNDENLIRLVNILGGAVVDTHDKCTILVAPRIIRTVKFLCCLTKGIPIVSADWLMESSKANKFLDPWLYITSDKAGEAKYKFDLKKSLKRALAAPLLKGFTVMGTESIIPQPKETEDIVKSSGGSFVYSIPNRGFKEPAFVISCVKDKKYWPKNNKKYMPPVVKAECLLTGILQQKLNLDQHILTV